MTELETRLVDVIVPAHNEEATIGRTLSEFYRVVHDEQGFPIRFIVCEDGSRDATVQVVEAVASELPLRLLSSPERKGYSRAVLDGLRAADAPLICFLDSDGQCDPADFHRLYDALGSTDMAIGYRAPRVDPFYRIAMSTAFKLAYQLLFPVRLNDPSCPYLLIRRTALTQVLRGNAGILQQGFWWEFNARAAAAGLAVTQIPVIHRKRQDGKTQVYRFKKIPSIALRHLAGLISLRRELAALEGVTPVHPVA